jgi:peptidoglycan glycosyltransferase/penicillin-binding protein 2
LLAGLLIRIAVLQLFPSNALAESAFRQRLSNDSVEKLRGNILDRNGISFTNRSTKYIALIKPAYIKKSDGDKAEVCKALGLEPGVLDGLNTNSSPFTVVTSKEGCEEIAKKRPEWVTMLYSLNRYDSGTLAKHIIGYLSKKDRVGQAGMEKAYEKELRDNAVFEIGAVTDAAKNPIKGMGYRLKTDGTVNKLNVKLTLDYHIQKIVEEVMEKSKVSGAVVVEDVFTGDILAMASKPDFDPDSVEKYLGSSGNELFNKATAAYNLGSVFKIVDVAATFEYTDITPEIDYCTGAVNVNGLEFKCSSYASGGHGELDLEQAFAESCNAYFIDLCLQTGYKNLILMAQRFGLGECTGIAGQGVNEAAGSLPPLKGYYSQADIANLAIGQGVLLATPLQVADMVATVANGGIRNKVNIVDSLVDEEGRKVKEIKVQEGHRIISRETAGKLKDLMEAVTSYGTGTAAGMEYYGGAGGKTGSAETGSASVVHAWFAGYFPIAQPRYSVVVFVENGQYGGKAAAPVFSEIARQMTDRGM